jgi:hypothetical protein
MASHVDRRTVDLSAFPDLVVILRDSGGTGFWHETYFMRGGMESIYADVNPPPVGLQAFAPVRAARGPMLSARNRSAPAARRRARRRL